MNENLFTPFMVPVMLGILIITLIIMFPTMLFPTPNQLINNLTISIQQWLTKLTSKQLMNTHNLKGQTSSLMLISLLLFIASTNLLGMLPHSFTPTTQLSMNMGMAISLWAGTIITGFRNKAKTSLAHLLPQGTPTFLIPMLVIIETISLLIQPVALAVWLITNITAGHLLLHLIGKTTLALMSTSLFTALITFSILTLLTILGFAVALIQAYMFTVPMSLYLHDNT